jgi:uncharacterized protein YcfL
MKLYRFLLALPLAIMLAGCAPVDSLNPLYNDQTVVFDPTLLGQWGTEQDGLNIARLDQDTYQLVLSGKDEHSGQMTTATFEAHLVNLQGQRFFDVVCKQAELAEGDARDFPEVHVTRTATGLEVTPRLVPTAPGAYMELLPIESDGDDSRIRVRSRLAHWIYKVVLEDEGRTLKLVQLDDEWIDQQIEDGNLVIDHENVDRHSAVLTASTPDLQQLVRAHVNDDEAFHGETVYQRAKQ